MAQPSSDIGCSYKRSCQSGLQRQRHAVKGLTVPKGLYCKQVPRICHAIGTRGCPFAHESAFTYTEKGGLVPKLYNCG